MLKTNRIRKLKDIIDGEVEITKVTDKTINYKLPYSDWEYDYEYLIDDTLESIIEGLSDDIRHNGNAMMDLIEESVSNAQNKLYLVEKE